MTKNDNYLPQMAEEDCGHQSNDSEQLIGSHFHIGQVTLHVEEVAFARNTENGQCTVFTRISAALD